MHEMRVDCVGGQVNEIEALLCPQPIHSFLPSFTERWRP